MSKALKYIAWTIAGLVGLVVAAVAFFVITINPNDYRDDISKLVKEKTGLVLLIKGDIGWQFYPAIGFSVEELSLAATEQDAPIASIGKAAVSVELMPLFSQQVNVQTLTLDRLVANLVMNAEGKGNWDVLPADGSKPEEEKPAEAGPTPKIRIPQLIVTNTIVDYEDQKTLAHYTVTIHEFSAENFTLDEEFPLHLKAKMAVRGGVEADLDTRASVTLNLDGNVYKVRGLTFAADVAGILAKPFHVDMGADIAADMNAKKIGITNLAVTASNLAVTARPMTVKVSGPVAVDLAAATATVGPLAFDAADVKGALAVNATDFDKETLAFTGTLDVAPFNAKNAMRTVGITPPETTDPLAMTKVALKAALAGGKTKAMLDNITITLDDTHITGHAGITDVATSAMAFDLKVDAINADRYLPPAAKTAAAPAATASAAAAPAAAPATKAGPLLPVDTLRKLNVDGKLGVGKITLMEWPMTNLAFGVKAAGGDIHLDPLAASVLEGTVKGNVRIDVRGEQPRIVTALKLDRIEVNGLVKRYAKKDLFAGKTSLNLNVDTTGNDMDTLLKKAIGGVDFAFSDALLKGTNLNGLLSQTLTEQLGAFAMLVPDYQQKLPKELSQDTSFSALAAKANIKDGIAQVPSFNAAVKEGNVRGGGDFNLVSMDFNYTVAMRTDKLKDNKYVGNMEFPFVCKGNIAGAPKDWCRPDTKAIGSALKDAAEKAAKDRVKGELAKRLGIESADSTALKQEAQKQIDQQKQEAEKKVKEEANKELQKAFQKFF